MWVLRVWGRVLRLVPGWVVWLPLARSLGLGGRSLALPALGPRLGL